MAYIKLELDHPLVDGEIVTFKAPCNSDVISGLKVYYDDITDSAITTTNKVFTFKDTHANNLTSIGNLFMTGAYVSVILDTTSNCAYIQNADTNGYLENKLTVLDRIKYVFGVENGIPYIEEL